MSKANKILILGLSAVTLAFSFGAYAEESCITIPTCAELGYTDTSCEAPYTLKCPFDQTKLFCPEIDLSHDCAIGNIVYCDGTCSDTYDSNKMVLGIYVSNTNIVALNHLSTAGTLQQDAVDGCEAQTRCGRSAHLPTYEEGTAWKNNATKKTPYFFLVMICRACSRVIVAVSMFLGRA